MVEKIVNILQDILVNEPDSIESCTTLIEDGYLDSFDIVSLVGELIEEFDVNITVMHLVPENFNSVAAMVNLIQDLS